jgi:tyrosine-protein kinase Etk/Wzc
MKSNDELFSSSTNYKAIIDRILDSKKAIFFTVLLFLIAAFIVNKYTPKVYSNISSILVLQEQGNQLLSNDVLKGLNLMGSKANIDNEVGALKSFELINKTISDLGLETSYFAEENPFFENTKKGSFLNITKEYYKEVPFTVLLDKSVFQPLYLEFYITFIDEHKFRLQADGEDITLFNFIENSSSRISKIHIDKIFQYGEPISDKNFSFKLIFKEGFSPEPFKNKHLFFYFNNPEYLTLQYQNNLTVEPQSINASVINISLKGGHPEIITDFLNSFTTGYLDKNLKKKNNFANSTVNFIDNQISDVADSLSIAQQKLQNFQTNNKVVDLSFQGQQIFTKLNQLETDKAQLYNQLKYYEYLRNYFRDNKQVDLLVPSSMNVVDPLLTQLISQLLQYTSEKSSYMSNDNTKNPNLVPLEMQIKNIKKTILENVSNNINTITNDIKEIDYRSSKMSADISGMPKTQLQLLGIERKFKLNDQIYTFLLQKRSEAQISRAANTPDYEIVETARRVTAGIVSPKVMMNYAIAILLGLLIPISVIMIKDFFNNKVMTKEDIEHITNKPIIGYAFHNYKKSNTVISDFPKSSIAESFRTIRTNLQIMFRGISKQVILVTSSGSGEGKSFISTNLALVFALLGKKTVLIGFDLRRPAIYQDLGLNNLIGISSYLSNRAILEDIIQSTRVENLDFISAGPVPPNPIELMGSNVTKNLIFKLKEIYDYIIIDTAPIGVVTDAFFLMNYVDLNLYIVRQNHTNKEMLTNTLKSLENNKISNLAIVLNDVYLKSRAHAYGYDSKYYVETDKTSIVKTILSKSGNTHLNGKESKKKSTLT